MDIFSSRRGLTKHSSGKNFCFSFLCVVQILTSTTRSDPWWIFTTLNLFWNIKHTYGFGFVQLIRVSPRFGILLLSMSLSVIFIVVDILSVTSVLKTGAINPFWKFSFVFKCFTDTIILDDFKTALDRIAQHRTIFPPDVNFSPQKEGARPSFELKNAGHIELCVETSEQTLALGRDSMV